MISISSPEVIQTDRLRRRHSGYLISVRRKPYNVQEKPCPWDDAPRSAPSPGLSLGSVAVGLGGCSSGGAAGSDPGSAQLRMAWWGNQTRTDLTGQVIDAYQQGTPGVTVAGEPAEWASYWDRLATQTAGSNAPDVIQMDLKYLRQYADRGALLDLGAAGVSTADFAEGTVDPGRTETGSPE